MADTAKKHSIMFNSIRMFYQDWHMITAEQVQEFVPYTITQEECDEILGKTNSDTDASQSGTNMSDTGNDSSKAPVDNGGASAENDKTSATDTSNDGDSKA
ncbi:MAG: hypothetical protein [Bacteriophage sp.]|nr:MAG: hypothetical protein [Bacteriophage sp.]